MAMTTETYADSIEEITITGTVLRIDFVSQAQAEGGGPPVKTVRQRIIMPLEGYAGSFDLLKRVFDNLVRSGAVARTGSLQDPAAGPPPASNRSPNFE
jgi:hypothetical protein